VTVLLVVVVLDIVLIGLFALLTRRRGLVDQRLGQLSQSGQVAVADAPKAPGKRASPFGRVLDQAVANRGFAETIRRDLARADIKLTVGEYLAVHVLVSFAFFAIGWFLFQAWFLGIVTAIAALFLPRMFVGSAQRKRLRTFENQLGDMLNLVVNGLRAGYSSMQALESVDPDVGTEGAVRRDAATVHDDAVARVERTRVGGGVDLRDRDRVDEADADMVDEERRTRR
jgi:tight adherence protein B